MKEFSFILTKKTALLDGLDSNGKLPNFRYYNLPVITGTTNHKLLYGGLEVP